jgi:endonuclease/exonuclease/phosphatase family metal-dependent hydrolase
VGEPYGTYPHYGSPRVGGRRIDGVLTTTDATVERVAVSNRRPGGVWPSDHAAVHAVVRWAS